MMENDFDECEDNFESGASYGDEDFRDIGE